MPEIIDLRPLYFTCPTCGFTQPTRSSVSQDYYDMKVEKGSAEDHRCKNVECGTLARYTYDEFSFDPPEVNDGG